MHARPGNRHERRLPRVHSRDAVTVPASLVHVRADLAGVRSGALRDTAMLTGLLIAAAGAAGLQAAGAPMLRMTSSGGASAVLSLDPGHISIHSFPERGLALVDVFARDDAGAAKALDVFVRRLAPASVQSDTRTRG